ncbi:hypothetical protein F66182_6012 [Fusarium sp. NRRL 66182]|nr:hypothetical protein F66182_6012 [Fusarium sp. NRRL 66182]
MMTTTNPTADSGSNYEPSEIESSIDDLSNDPDDDSEEDRGGETASGELLDCHPINYKPGDDEAIEHDYSPLEEGSDSEDSDSESVVDKDADGDEINIQVEQTTVSQNFKVQDCLEGMHTIDLK